MKTCLECKEEKPLEDFWKKASNADGRDARCGDCARAYHRRLYHNNDSRKAQIRKAARVNRQKLRDWVTAYLETHPCVDCGFSDRRALQFDHVRGDKVGNVSDMVSKCGSLDKIKAEVAKCEVRCANCHMIVTQERSRG